MHIEIQKQGKKKKYYLAHSFREGKKVKKIRRYLGSDLPKKQIEKLRIRAGEILKQQIESYKVIKDPLKYELKEKDIKKINNISLPLKIRHLSEEEWQGFIEVFTYNTNAIEGSEVTQKEVEQILEKDSWPSDVSKQDISETYGVAEAINYIRRTKTHLSIKLIQDLHKIVFKNSKSFAGKFRTKGTEVVIRDGTGNILHVGAPSNRIAGLIEELVVWYGKNKEKYPVLVLAAVVHNQFENIHPFEDGNGRVGRLLLNNILLKHKFSPVNVSFTNRRDYYGAIRAYQNKGDIKPTIDLILKEYKNLKNQLR